MEMNMKPQGGNSHETTTDSATSTTATSTITNTTAAEIPSKRQ